MKEKINALSNRVLIKPDLVSEVQNGIISGYETNEDTGEIIRKPRKPHTGVVLSVGSKVPQIKPGMKLIFPTGGATVLQENGEDVLMYRACDIFAILEGKNIIPLAL
jgi:co-chaperonin GroES (HSP10)